MKVKSYKFEFLYDNGIIETFDTGLITDNELQDALDIIYNSFGDGLEAGMQIPNGTGHNAYINVSKVTRVNLLP
jgi:hypothetical protein